MIQKLLLFQIEKNMNGRAEYDILKGSNDECRTC